MHESWFELAIIAFIICGIGVAVWKGGAANPESTGELGKKLAKLENKVTGIGSKVSTIERQVTDIDQRFAKASDILRLEHQVEQLANTAAQLRDMAATSQEAATQRGRQLDRLYDFIVEKGMTK